MTKIGRAYVRKLRLGRVATVDERGRPHCVPVLYAYDGKRLLWMSSSSSRKVRNVARSGRAAVAVDDGAGVRGVMVEGRARVVSDGDEFERCQDALLAAGTITERRSAGDEVVVELVPEQWVEWGLESLQRD